MPFVVGENIGPYRILEQLGRGGMATVFKAYHAALDRYVAIKALHPAFMEDPNFHARFQREARVVAKLEHPNIVPIYDFAEYESRPYLVMKYIEGETLKARSSEGAIAQEALIRIVEAVGAGLAYAHKKGILHRDVKPSNVLLGFDDGVYLADFGLARIAQAGESTLSSDMMLGTPQYISPEQAMGLGELDERTDIYSFGVMLYELAVGKVPFSADTPFSIIHDHIYTPLPLPRTVNPDVPEAVERVLLKALAKERNDRYPDAETLATAFIEAVSAEPNSIPMVIPPLEQIETPEPAVLPVKTAPEPSAIPTPVPDPVAEPETPIDSPPLKPSPVSTSKKPRKRFRWWFIPLGIILVIGTCYCSLVGFGAVLDFLDNGQIDPPAAEHLPKPPLDQPFEDSIPLEDAQLQVEDNPVDPDVWLNLAEAHWAVGEVDEARAALNQALEVAGDDPEFYFETASYLADAQFWVDSARIYLDGIQRFYGDAVPPELLDEFHESVYWASEFENAEHDIPIPEIARVDLPMERVAKARYMFHFVDENEAFSFVEQLLAEIQPGMPEALYLQSEIFYSWGDNPSAFNILYQLQEREDTPEWIREIVDQILQDAFLMQQQAQEQIEADPENPYVYLPLYEWYLSFGLYEEAYDVLQQALRLAGEEVEFILAASEVAARTGAWLQNAQILRYAGQLNPGIVNPEFSEDIIQALYYGATEPGALEVFGEIDTFIQEGERGLIREAYRDALIARYKLHYEDVGEARALIEDVVDRTPILALPRLVQAETYIFLGDLPQAEAVLHDVQNSRTSPPWVKEEAQFLLDEIIIKP